jgi:Protein of unknown function (DUF2794)
MLGPMVDETIEFDHAEARPSAWSQSGGGPACLARESNHGAQGAPFGRAQPHVRFDRLELKRILNIYGRMVIAGEWRDYAVDFLGEAAVFSIYRRSSEMPMYRVEKRPHLRARQGQYAVIAASGQILKRGHDLPAVLRVFDRKLLKALMVE